MLQIKKILFPTSCSDNSKKALLYTLTIAKYIGATIDVLYVCEPKVDILVPSVMRFSLLQEQKQNAEALLDNWLKEFKIHNIIQHQEVELGYAKETIGLYANKRPEIDLIIMGIKDTNSLVKLIFGTIISRTVETANTAVLVVPKGIVFQEIKNIAYLSPIDQNWQNNLPRVQQIAQDLKAKLIVTHLSKNDYEIPTGETHVILENYDAALQALIYNANLQLLVTISAVQNTLTRLFRFSKTQKMALNTTIPLLVLRKEN